MSVYDSNWNISYNIGANGVADPSSEPGLFIGNGKVGITTSFEPKIDVAQTVITSQLKYYNGAYKANITETFNVNNVKLFENNDTVSYTHGIQQLNMQYAIFTESNMVVTPHSAYANVARVNYDLYAPRHLPYCIMQSFRIKLDNNADELMLYHEVYAKDTIVDVEYNNNVIYNETINANKGLYVLSGKGRARNTGDQVVCASCYLFEGDDTSYENLGFNVYRQDMNRCYNKFRLNNLVAGTEYRFHIVSALMTSFDIDNPGEEVKRIVLNVTNKASTYAGVAADIRGNHTNMWLDMWNTNVNITPKTGITIHETNELMMLQRAIRYSLYNIYSSVRENVSVEVNPLNLSVIDFDGGVLYDGDLWLLPVLLMLKTDVARALLEYRHKLIDVARQLAAGYGYKGAKYPYLNDNVGYKNTLYWDVVGPMSIFNTGLISINVWNYYRITRDKDWMRDKGYTILKENADFFASKIKKHNDGSYHLEDVVGISGVRSADQSAFTNNIARLALRYAMEASYELQYAAKQAWVDCYYNLPMPYFPNPLLSSRPEVLKFDAASTTSSVYDLAEPLFALLPYYNKLYYLPELNHTPTSLLNNLNHYSTHTSGSTTSHPYNRALFATLYGNYAQSDPNYVCNFKDTLYNFLTENTHGIWKHMATANGKNNDIILNSILLFMIIQGIPQMTVNGGVAESRFYYEDMRISALTTANMPSTWRNIRIAGTGVNGNTSTTTNVISYLGTPGC